MTISINVKHHEHLGKRTNHIESINLVHHTDDVILLEINLRTKRKEISAYGGATDSGCQSFWIGFNEVQLTLPEGFKDNIIFAEASRYTIFVCIYRRELIEKMIDTNYDDVVLWECPDDC